MSDSMRARIGHWSSNSLSPEPLALRPAWFRLHPSSLCDARGKRMGRCAAIGGGW
jgi:hypothetical protein